jgi:hypothetical protein
MGVVGGKSMLRRNVLTDVVWDRGIYVSNLGGGFIFGLFYDEEVWVVHDEVENGS